MKDKEIFDAFMSWMGMGIDRQMQNGKETIVTYALGAPDDSRFSSVGYDEFWAGAIFDEDGNMIKGFLDSHVCHSSKNCKLIEGMLNNMKRKK
jgi:hypothetical protein